MAEKPVYVFDTFALLAYFQAEQGASRISEILQAAQRDKCRACFSLINLGELLYIIERRRGLPAAQEILAAIQQLPIEILPADEQAVFAAAHVKANHPISYADAFAVAAAQGLKGIVLTGDPEFSEVEKIMKAEWLKEPRDNPK